MDGVRGLPDPFRRQGPSRLPSTLPPADILPQTAGLDVQLAPVPPDINRDLLRRRNRRRCSHRLWPRPSHRRDRYCRKRGYVPLRRDIRRHGQRDRKMVLNDLLRSLHPRIPISHRLGRGRLGCQGGRRRSCRPGRLSRCYRGRRLS